MKKLIVCLSGNNKFKTTIMLKKQFSRYVMAAGFMISFSGILHAQVLKINPAASKMTISGTTNVHDFESNVTQINGQLVIDGTKKVESLSVKVPVKSIKSKEKLMDTKTYEALEANNHPTISFQMTDASSLKINGQNIDVVVTGNLSLAGETRKISFRTTGKSTKPGVYEFKGSIPLKMTDFKVTPPKAMMGMMKVGNEITLKYHVVLEGGPETSNLLQ